VKLWNLVKFQLQCNWTWTELYIVSEFILYSLHVVCLTASWVCEKLLVTYHFPYTLKSTVDMWLLSFFANAFTNVKCVNGWFEIRW